jgi:site-specific recombinase XerD
MSWQNNFSTHLLLEKNLALGTTKAYKYDASRYASFATQLGLDEIANIDLAIVPFNKILVRNFAASLRKKKLAESTIERHIHGVLAFWNYCYELKYTDRPLPFQHLDLHIKSSKNPTTALTNKEYTHFMSKLYAELQRIY